MKITEIEKLIPMWRNLIMPLVLYAIICLIGFVSADSKIHRISASRYRSSDFDSLQVDGNY